MVHDKLLSVVEGYASGILRECEPEQLSEEQYEALDIDSGDLMSHLKWMCEEIVTGRVAGEKAHRWLGYIQGELRAMGLFTISDLRRHSRG